MLGALGGEGDENFRAGDDLEPGGMMLANPCLVKAELVEPLHQLEVAFEALRRVFLIRMERRQEDPVAEVDLGHRNVLNLRGRLKCCHCARGDAIPCRRPAYLDAKKRLAPRSSG